MFSPHVACHYALCHMSNLRNAHVDLSILGVKGHMSVGMETNMANTDHGEFSVESHIVVGGSVL